MVVADESGMKSVSRLLLPLLLTVAGCIAPKNKTTSTVLLGTGLTLAVVGVAVYASSQAGPGEDTDGNGIDEFPDQELSCLVIGSPCTTGLLLAFAGLGVASSGVIGLTASAEPPRPLPARAVDETYQLPSRATDAVTLRMAQQARIAAVAGRCDAAQRTLDTIRSRDTTYYVALTQTSLMAPCQLSASGRR